MIPATSIAIILTGIVVIGIAWGLDYLWAVSITTRWVYLAARAPGIIVHECSHILGCLLTGAKVQKIVLLSRDGGSVSYTKSPVPILGELVINTAPLFCIPVVLVGCTWIFSTYLGCTIPVLSPSFESVEALDTLAHQISGMFAANLIDRFNPWFLLYLYLTVSLVLSLAPSRQDLKNAAFGAVSIIAFMALVFWSQYFSKFTSVNFGKSSILSTSDQPNGRRTETNETNLSFFRIPSQTNSRKKSKRNKSSATVLGPR